MPQLEKFKEKFEPQKVSNNVVKMVSTYVQLQMVSRLYPIIGCSMLVLLRGHTLQSKLYWKNGYMNGESAFRMKLTTAYNWLIFVICFEWSGQVGEGNEGEN